MLNCTLHAYLIHARGNEWITYPMNLRDRDRSVDRDRQERRTDSKYRFTLLSFTSSPPASDLSELRTDTDVVRMFHMRMEEERQTI